MWPGLGEILYEQGHPKALEFPRASISEVDIGKGWAKGGFEVVLFPYKAGIDRMSEGLAVSFWDRDFLFFGTYYIKIFKSHFPSII